MADMQRPSRIGGNKFDLDFFSLPELAAPILRAECKNALHHLLFGGRLEKQIDKSRASDFGFFDQQRRGQGVQQLFRHIAWVAAQQLSQLHRQITCVVAVQCMFRLFQFYTQARLIRRHHAECFTEQFSQVLFDISKTGRHVYP